MKKATNAAVITFIQSHSYLKKQDSDARDLCHSTRKHCMSSQQFGQADINEAYKVKDLLEKEFDNLDIEVNTCDEWVSLNVFLN